VVHLIDQIAVASRRARELKSESRKAPSEDEGRRMQFEAKLLEDSIQALYKELLDLAPQDPASVVEFVKSDRGHVIRHSLMNMIKASVELEIEGEHSPSGPLLSGLLTLANGSTDDRWTILQFVRSLARANRAVGEAAFSLLADADYELRNEAAAVLSTHARRGNLREFLLENEAALRQAALTNLGVNDYQARGSALIALAALGTPESDDFVLQRFEALEDMRDVHHGIEAILHIAPRIAERHEARIYNSLLRTLEMPFYQICKQEVLELAFFLPREKCLQVLRLAQMKATADDPGTANVAAGFIHAVEAGQQETWRNAVEKQRRERFKGGIPYLLEQRRGARAIISQ
jgi:hypothetical protein